MTIATRKSKIENALDLGTYPGGKNAAGVWQWIVEQMPTHACYAEPFVGSGAVLRRKLPALRSVVLDVDPEVIGWWRKQVRWPGLEVLQGCGIDWLNDHAGELDDDWLVNCDPPYPHETRNKGKLNIYHREWSQADHRRFLTVVQKLRCLVMVHSYGNDLYDRMLASWHRQTRWSMTRGGKRLEVLWTNFEPSAGHVVVGEAVRVSGANWRERERIGRKQRRWQQNYRRLPPSRTASHPGGNFGGRASAQGGRMKHPITQPPPRRCFKQMEKNCSRSVEIAQALSGLRQSLCHRFSQKVSPCCCWSCDRSMGDLFGLAFVSQCHCFTQRARC